MLILQGDSTRVALYHIAFLFPRHGGSSSKNKQEYKPDVKLEYYDDNGRPLTPKEVRCIRKPSLVSAVFLSMAFLGFIIGLRS